MVRLSAICILAVLVAIPVLAQSTTPPQPTNPQDSSSRTRPDAAPTPPDAPSPDLGTQAAPPSKSKAKKIANKFDPHCIDVIFHACWSSPEVAQPGKPLTEEEEHAQQAAKDIDVGYYYLNQKN